MQWRLREENLSYSLSDSTVWESYERREPHPQKVAKWDFIMLSKGIAKAVKLNRCRELLPNISNIYDLSIYIYEGHMHMYLGNCAGGAGHRVRILPFTPPQN